MYIIEIEDTKGPHTCVVNKRAQTLESLVGQKHRSHLVLFQTITYCHYELHGEQRLPFLEQEFYEAGSGSGECKRSRCKFEV